MARPSNRDERRRHLTRAAITAIAELGIDGASTRRIADLAGLTQGLVHYHFESKTEILLEAVELLAREATERIARKLQKAGGPREQVHAFLDALLEPGADANPDAVAAWVAIVAEATRDSDVHRAVLEVLQNWQGHLESLCGAVTNGLRTPQRAASALMAFVQGCFMQASLDPRLVPAGSAAPAARAMADALLPEGAS